jgi:hypothetical protein
MASMIVFAIITLGLAPLMAISLRGTNTGRLGTVGKELAQNSIERLEGMTWYVSYDSKPNKRVDLLDLYYPAGSATTPPAGSTYASTTNPPLTGTGGVYTSTCPPPSGTNPACPTSLPASYTVTFKATFVKANGTTPETYQIVSPPAAYAWNSQGNDAPPADLMDVNVTTSWTIAGKTSSYSLRTLLSNRHFSPISAVDATSTASPTPTSGGAAPPGGLKVQGRATLDYAMQVNTGYKSTASPCTVSVPCYSDLNATFAKSESLIQTQQSSTASQNQAMADFHIVRTYPSPQTPPASPPPDLSSVTVGATSKQAPPAYNVAQTSTGPSQTVTHPDLSNASEAMDYGADVKNVKVDVSNELPIAEGYEQTFGTTTGVQEGYINNTQIDYTNKHIVTQASQPMAYFVRLGGVPDVQLNGYTTADTYALGGASRGVETKVHDGFADLTTLRNSSMLADMLDIQGFTQTIDCKATANPATAVGTSTWSTLTITGYYDPSNNGSPPNNNGKAPYNLVLNSSGNDSLQLNGGAFVSYADGTAALEAANPLEFDGATAATDIYMFEERDANGNITKNGYFSDLSENKTPTIVISSDGRSVSVDQDAVIRLTTASLNATQPDTATSFAIGKGSCMAVDNR